MLYIIGMNGKWLIPNLLFLSSTANGEQYIMFLQTNLIKYVYIIGEPSSSTNIIQKIHNISFTTWTLQEYDDNMLIKICVQIVKSIISRKQCLIMNYHQQTTTIIYLVFILLDKIEGIPSRLFEKEKHSVLIERI